MNIMAGDAGNGGDISGVLVRQKTFSFGLPMFVKVRFLLEGIIHRCGGVPIVGDFGI